MNGVLGFAITVGGRVRYLLWTGLIFMAACGDPRVAEILELTGDVDAGETLYDDNCALCHGDDGLGDIGSDLTVRIPDMSDEEIVTTVLLGLSGTTMPSFADLLDNQGVADVVAYSKTGFDSE